MPYTALQLITRSYYLSQIVSRGLETVSGEQISDGLFLLNSLIEFKNSDLRMIPYFKRYEFDLVNGQEEYFIPNLLFVDTMTFNIGPVRYSMREMTRKDFFGNSRVDNIQTLPFSYRVEREIGGSRIYLYFVPGGDYKLKISGKFGLDSVLLTDDMSLTYDLYYIEYLRYALAEYICSDYGVTFPDESKAKMKEIEKKVMDVSPPDISIRKNSYFSRGDGLDWQSVNLSNGYWPF